MEHLGKWGGKLREVGRSRGTPQGAGHQGETPREVGPGAERSGRTLPEAGQQGGTPGGADGIAQHLVRVAGHLGGQQGKAEPQDGGRASCHLMQTRIATDY